MALSAVSGVRFSGVGACVPRNIGRISDYKAFTPEAAERFTKQTGIAERRMAPAGMSASDMCAAAAERLLEELRWGKGEIEGLFYVSQSPDYPLPSTACILQDVLGLPKSCMALEISYGCSGYVYGLAVAASMVSAMKLKKVLLLVGEKTLAQHSESNTAFWPLFGDVGSATALEFDAAAPDMFFDLCSDGSGKDCIIRRAGGIRHPFEASDLEFSVELENGGKMRPVDCYLDGPAIMEFTIREVKPSVVRALKLAGKSADDIDLFFAHQANRIINETARKMLKIPPEKTPCSIDKFANTSGVSIPLTMAARSANALKSGKSLNLLSGFGVGLSWGSAVIETDGIAVPPLVEI